MKLQDILEGHVVTSFGKKRKEQLDKEERKKSDKESAEALKQIRQGKKWDEKQKKYVHPK